MDPLSVEVAVSQIDEESVATNNQLSYTATLSSSYIAPEELDEEIKEKDKEKEKEKKKKVLKILEEPIRKRKDTANSISNFFHRFTTKPEKKIAFAEEVNRPDRLLSPEVEEKWFESDTFLPFGHEGGAELYEWDPLTMNETLVTGETGEKAGENQNLTQENSTFFEEKSMLKLLEEFRNGEMRWLAEPQVSAMCRVKEAHEDVTKTHLMIHDIEKERRAGVDLGLGSFTSEEEIESDKIIEQLFEQMNVQMTKMHTFLDKVPFYDDAQNLAPNDEEYYSS
ncbi:unnamed protein product [Caenorhabditis angaria]|uniref:Uncharacterized protein n=1 Tax=Caenorhabditis angaria TaxID=860376 RepID=A0A9P1N1S8_9PELO|nr:unnamed protein product [Caenorhabditis angaria]